jgi:betaine-aldehyde dehydrogenase
MRIQDRLYINGEWVSSHASGVLEVVNASTEEVMAKVPAGSSEDVDRAARAARRAFEAWAMTPAAERARCLRALQEGLVARAEEIARTITGEVGMPLALSRTIQAGLPIRVMASYAEMLEGFCFEERIGNSLVVREPVGVVGAITPWNYPLHQVVAKVAPALAAGCTVVLKPSEVAPLSAFVLAEVVHSAGLPPGVFNLVCGTGPVVGEALAAHPDVWT